MENKVLFLTACRDAMEAEIVKGALADMGIECILQGKNMSHLYGGIAAMGVNVLVDEADYRKARAFIDSRDDIKFDPEEWKVQKEPVSKIVGRSALDALIISVLLLLTELLTDDIGTRELVTDFIIRVCMIFVVFVAIRLVERRYFSK